jgi:hypothetical protein
MVVVHALMIGAEISLPSPIPISESNPQRASPSIRKTSCASIPLN